MQQQLPSSWPIRPCPQAVPEETISRRACPQRKTRIGNMVLAVVMLFACLAIVVAAPVCAVERTNILKNNQKRKGRIMKRQWLKNSSVLFVVIVFSLMSGVALAQKNHWFVVKDKNGVCKVIEAKEKTPATIAGPFKTKEEAEKRKAKDCPQGAGEATEQLRYQQEQGQHKRPQQEQAEPMRRQHQQREEPQQRQLKQEQTPHQQQLAPQQPQQTEKMKGKAQEKIEGAKPTEEKVKEKTKEPIPSDKKN
jgi:hypothetical protein